MLNLNLIRAAAAAGSQKSLILAVSLPRSHPISLLPTRAAQLGYFLSIPRCNRTTSYGNNGGNLFLLACVSDACLGGAHGGCWKPAADCPDLKSLWPLEWLQFRAPKKAILGGSRRRVLNFVAAETVDVAEQRPCLFLADRKSVV